MIQTIEQIEQDFEVMGVDTRARDKFISVLVLLRSKDQPTFEHSVRTAYLCKDIAKFTNLVPKKTLWLPGLVHDAGKLLIRPEVLKKTVGFDAKDYEEMKNHVEYGCKMLTGIADFSAFALFYHHFFKYKGAYPKSEDFARIFGNRFDGWSEGTRTLAKYCGRLMSVADFYDAVTTRENDKYSPGHPRLPTRNESRELLIQENKDQSHLIERLYDTGIFK